MQGNILKDLLFKSYELGVNAKFTPIKREEYDAWVSRQGKESFVITLSDKNRSLINSRK